MSLSERDPSEFAPELAMIRHQVRESRRAFPDGSISDDERFAAMDEQFDFESRLGRSAVKRIPENELFMQLDDQSSKLGRVARWWGRNVLNNLHP